MAYEFKRLSDVEVVETPTEIANVLIEEDGVIKKAPKTAVGGAGGSTLIVTSSKYLSEVASYENGVTKASAIAIEYTANMTLDEAVAAMRNQELTGAIAYIVDTTPVCFPMAVYDYYTELGTGENCIRLAVGYGEAGFWLYWTSDGISTNSPFGHA